MDPCKDTARGAAPGIGLGLCGRPDHDLSDIHAVRLTDGVGYGLSDGFRRHCDRSARRDLSAQSLIPDVFRKAGGREPRRQGGDAQGASKLLPQAVADCHDGGLRA